MNKKIITPNGKEIELESWPGHYYVIATIEGFRSGDWLYEVTMTMSRYKSSDKNISPQESMGFPEDYYIDDETLAAISEAFSEQEADELVVYLNSLEGFQATKRQVYCDDEELFNRRAHPMEAGDYLWNIPRHEGYPLGFKVYGYFNLGDENRIGPSPEEVFRGEIKNTLKWCPTAEREQVLHMILDLINENGDRLVLEQDQDSVAQSICNNFKS